jgi:hypothetical protein
LSIQAAGQSVSYKDTLMPFRYPVITNTVTIHDTIHVTDTVIVYKPSPCDSDTAIVQPSYKVQAMYVSPIGDWLASPDKYLTWAKREGVNELNLYARAYLETSSKRTQLAAFIKKAKEQYGIKRVTNDYRLTSELTYWKAYNDTYKGTTSALDAMLTEREPYVTGDYTGFYPFLREGSAFAKSSGIELNCYMGHPSDQAWDSIVFYCDKVYLSLYITMSTWGNSTNGYNYVAGRWAKIAASAKKLNKLNYPVAYIISLERKTWGASNDMMGEWYTTNSFYGATVDTYTKQYNTNSSQDIKDYTNLIGTVIFYSKYGVLARP